MESPQGFVEEIDVQELSFHEVKQEFDFAGLFVFFFTGSNFEHFSFFFFKENHQKVSTVIRMEFTKCLSE